MKLSEIHVSQKDAVVPHDNFWVVSKGVHGHFSRVPFFPIYNNGNSRPGNGDVTKCSREITRHREDE